MMIRNKQITKHSKEKQSMRKKLIYSPLAMLLLAGGTALPGQAKPVNYLPVPYAEVKIQENGKFTQLLLKSARMVNLSRSNLIVQKSRCSPVGGKIETANTGKKIQWSCSWQCRTRKMIIIIML
jgi:hypothetical protein